MKTKCKLLAYLLAALMMVGVLPAAALADGDDVDTAAESVAAPVQEVLDTAAQESGSEAAVPAEEPVFFELYDAPATLIEVSSAQELNDALEVIADGGTIRLLADIEYESPLYIGLNHVTIDLNSHTLLVNLNRFEERGVVRPMMIAAGVYVSGGALELEGAGKLNVTAPFTGVYVSNGGSAEVSNVTVSYESEGFEEYADYSRYYSGVYAVDDDSRIDVSGNVVVNGDDCPGGVYAEEGAAISVGDVTVTGEESIGVSSFENSTVAVSGNVTVNGVMTASVLAIYSTVTVDGDATSGIFGIIGQAMGTITVHGDVSATADPAMAVMASAGGRINVGGNVTASGESGIGAMCMNEFFADGNISTLGRISPFALYGEPEIDRDNEITIDGVIDASIYIMMDETEMTADQGVAGEAPYAQYLIYTDDAGNTVRVKIPTAATVAGDDDGDDPGIYVREGNLSGQSGEISADLTKGSTTLSSKQIAWMTSQNSQRPIVLSGSGYTLTFPVGSLKRNNLSGYDLSVRFNSGPNHEIIRRLAGKGYIGMLEFAHSGELPGTAQLRVKVGKKYAGMTLLYQYYNSETGTLETIETVTVDEDGYVTLTQDHCSAYALTLASEAPAVPMVDLPSGTDVNPETGARV
jgi:hypothetical protein